MPVRVALRSAWLQDRSLESRFGQSRHRLSWNATNVTVRTLGFYLATSNLQRYILGSVLRLSQQTDGRT